MAPLRLRSLNIAAGIGFLLSFIVLASPARVLAAANVIQSDVGNHAYQPLLLR
jgi:hypothetical protein